MGGGLLAVIIGFKEVIYTQYNKVDENTVPLNPSPVTGPFLHDRYVGAVGTTFRTNDIFSVNNTINGQIQVYLINNIHNVTGFGAVVVAKQSYDFLHMNQQDLNDTLSFFLTNKMLINNGKYQTANEYVMNFTWNPQDETTKTIWVFLQTNDIKLHPYNGPDFPTIAPASALIELKNTKIVTGLTWIIIGAIPIGLVSELCIIYFTERHFHELEKRVYILTWMPNRLHSIIVRIKKKFRK